MSRVNSKRRKKNKWVLLKHLVFFRSKMFRVKKPKTSSRRLHNELKITLDDKNVFFYSLFYVDTNFLFTNLISDSNL